MFSKELSVSYRGRNLYIKNLVGRDFKRNFERDGKKFIYMNFAGGPDQWNARGGSRYFHIYLPRDLATDMANEGWKIYNMDQEEYDPYIKVNINYPKEDSNSDYGRNLVNNAPRASIVRDWTYNNGRVNGDVTELSESEIGSLDYVRIDHAELNINGWVNRKGQLTAYLNSIVVFLEEDPYLKTLAMIRGGEDEHSEEDEDESIPFN